LATRPPQLVGEARQGHRFSKALFDRELQVLTEKRSVDVFLVRFDHGVRIRARRLLHAYFSRTPRACATLAFRQLAVV
jgi:hypothetical protein